MFLINLMVLQHQCCFFMVLFGDMIYNIALTMSIILIIKDLSCPCASVARCIGVLSRLILVDYAYFIDFLGGLLPQGCFIMLC